MISTIINNQITQFSALVKRVFQSRGGYTKGTTRIEANVIGGFFQFPVMSHLVATPRAYGDFQNPQDPGNTHVVAALLPWAVSVQVDRLEQQLINYSEMANDVILSADAFGRRYDQTVINTLNAPGAIPSGNIIPYNFGPDNTLNYDKLLQAFTLLNEFAAFGERFFIGAATAHEQLLGVEQFTNFFYVSDRPIENSGLTTADGSRKKGPFGINYVQIPEMYEGGMPYVGSPAPSTVRYAYLYHPQALGIAMGQFVTMAAPAPQWLSDVMTTGLRIGGIVIDPRGVIAIEYDEAAFPFAMELKMAAYGPEGKKRLEIQKKTREQLYLRRREQILRTSNTNPFSGRTVQGDPHAIMNSINTLGSPIPQGTSI